MLQMISLQHFHMSLTICCCHKQNPFSYFYKAGADKLSKSLESQMNELNDKLDQSQRQINELSADKSRLTNANNDLQRQLEEAQEAANNFGKSKSSLGKQLEELQVRANIQIMYIARKGKV